ncbi:MAG: LLM class flavin-dependent oxidoreductase [Ktedonobacterales bacterium]
MRFAINLPQFNAFADPRALADLAREAEDAGWDGFFLWDHMLSVPGIPILDPWVALAAIAMSTERIRIGPIVTPLPRRRPWKVAREAATLDQLSHGRLTLGVGLGWDEWREYSAFGESPNDKTHAAMLDEGLNVMTGLWSGAPFSYSGQHYTVRDAQFLPAPVQSPRIPIWVACLWPNKAPLRRAARWDGVCPILGGPGRQFTPDEVREMLAYIQQHRVADSPSRSEENRESDAPFDMVLAGYVGNEPAEQAAERLRAYAEAGVTWWQEGFWWDDTPDIARERIRQGPPKL